LKLIYLIYDNYIKTLMFIFLLVHERDYFNFKICSNDKFQSNIRL
jgi:hypothetical protein